jgi:hypothetical protein
MDREAKRQLLAQLRDDVRRLERELNEDGSSEWPPTTYYAAYHILAGFVLGIFGASASLLFNVVGSLLVGQHPLQLIRVYLTFPLGEAALGTENSLALAMGCSLYLGTGMLLGIPFQLFLTRFFAGATFGTRLMAGTFFALVVWLVNFYGVLLWLQPLLFGGRWITDEIPVWVAAVTHLVFGWTMVLAYPLGQFVPYGETGGQND